MTKREIKCHEVRMLTLTKWYTMNYWRKWPILNRNRLKHFCISFFNMKISRMCLVLYSCIQALLWSLSFWSIEHLLVTNFIMLSNTLSGIVVLWIFKCTYMLTHNCVYIYICIFIPKFMWISICTYMFTNTYRLIEREINSKVKSIMQKQNWNRSLKWPALMLEIAFNC